MARGANIGRAHAIGGQQAGHGMEKNILHAKRIGHEAGVLAARTAETVERVARHIIAALDGNFLDGLDHIGNRNADETISNRFRRTTITNLGCERGEAFAHPLHI